LSVRSSTPAAIIAIPMSTWSAPPQRMIARE
jgi:hypothetical protein